MKKFFVLVAFFALSLSTFAQKTANFSTMCTEEPSLKATAAKAASISAIPWTDNSIKSDNQFQDDEFNRTIFDLRDMLGAGRSYGFAGRYTMPVYYEPHSNYLFTITLGRYGLDTADPLYQTHLMLRGAVWYTNDFDADLNKSENWSRIFLYNDTVKQDNDIAATWDYLYPAVFATNAAKTNSIDDVSILTHTKTLTWQPGQTNGSWGSFFGLTNGTMIGNETPGLEYDESAPIGNNPGEEYIFFNMKGIGVEYQGKPYGLLYGRAEGPNDNSPSSYSAAVFELDGLENMTDGSEAIKWTTKLPNSVMKDGPFNDAVMAWPNYSGVSMGYDEEGTIYVGLCGKVSSRFGNGSIHPDFQDTRVPLVIRGSIDEQYGNFVFNSADSLPASVVRNFLTTDLAHENPTVGTADTESNSWSFQLFNNNLDDIAFSVIGKDHYSFFTVFGFSYAKPNGDPSYQYRLVEVSNKNGAWKMRDVSTLKSRNNSKDEVPAYESFDYGPYVLAPGTIARLVRGTDTVPFFKFNYYNDMQLSKTADNKYFVAKWTDCNPLKDTVKLDNPITIWFKNMNSQITDIDTTSASIDKVYFSRMYVSYRHIDSNKWSKPSLAYFSDVDTLDMYGTCMPSIVPSIKQIPILTTKSHLQTSTYPIQGKLPKILQNSFESYLGACLVIADATIVSVEEKEPSDVFNLENAYPNPATSIVNFKFSLQKPANTKLVIHNAMGQVVATVLDQYCNANEYKTSFNTANLPTGAYYYTLTSGEIVETRMFNVIR